MIFYAPAKKDDGYASKVSSDDQVRKRKISEEIERKNNPERDSTPFVYLRRFIYTSESVTVLVSW